MSKYTPGPWHHELEDVLSGRGRILGPNGEWIARYIPKEHFADACLIAAAPDLLEALRKADDFIAILIAGNADCIDWEGVRSDLRAVIAKAEGA